LKGHTRWCGCVFLLLAGWSVAAHAEEILYHYAKSIRLADRDIPGIADKIASFETNFDKALSLVNQAELSRLSNDDVEDFFEISMTLSFYSNEPHHTQQMRRAYDEMARRGLAKRRMGQRMRDHYVASRMIEEAREFAESRPELDLKVVPDFRRPARVVDPPTLWRLSRDGRTLDRERFRLGTGAHLVVVSSPWCSFSQAASASIAEDKELSRLMRRHSTWILAQSMIPDFDDIKTWNDAFAGRPMRIVEKNNQWAWVPSWDTPGFYFMKDGKIVTEVIGWPGPEQRAKLKAGFATVGIRVQ